jgi:hypothetical protein
VDGADLATYISSAPDLSNLLEFAQQYGGVNIN